MEKPQRYSRETSNPYQRTAAPQRNLYGQQNHSREKNFYEKQKMNQEQSKGDHNKRDHYQSRQGPNYERSNQNSGRDKQFGGGHAQRFNRDSSNYQRRDHQYDNLRQKGHHNQGENNFRQQRYPNRNEMPDNRQENYDRKAGQNRYSNQGYGNNHLRNSKDQNQGSNSKDYTENSVRRRDMQDMGRSNKRENLAKVFNLGGVEGNIIGADRQTISLSSHQNQNRLLMEEDLDQEMDDAFGEDEDFNPVEKEIAEARLIAEDYLQLIKIRFPNRYFILKKIAQDPYHWEACLQKNFVIITDSNYTRKLQNCFEVTHSFSSHS